MVNLKPLEEKKSFYKKLLIGGAIVAVILQLMSAITVSNAESKLPSLYDTSSTSSYHSYLYDHAMEEYKNAHQMAAFESAIAYLGAAVAGYGLLGMMGASLLLANRACDVEESEPTTSRPAESKEE